MVFKLSIPQKNFLEPNCLQCRKMPFQKIGEMERIPYEGQFLPFLPHKDEGRWGSCPSYPQPRRAWVCAAPTKTISKRNSIPSSFTSQPLKICIRRNFVLLHFLSIRTFFCHPVLNISNFFTIQISKLS